MLRPYIAKLEIESQETTPSQKRILEKEEHRPRQHFLEV